MSANNAHPRGSGSGSSSGPSSSASSPTKRSHRQTNFLSPPPPNRSTSPLPRRRPASPSAVFAAPPLHLTVRFSAALPDLHLDILTPQLTTIATLKHLIRARLAADAKSSSPPDSGKLHNAAADAASRARLRFIHAGKILPDSAALST